MSAKKISNSKGIIIGVLILLFAAVLFLIGESHSVNSISASSQVAQDKVNSHLQELNRELVIKDQKALIETQNRIEELKKSRPQESYHHQPNQLEFSEYQERQYFNEQVGRGQKGFGLPSDPNQLVQKDLFLDQKDQQFDEAYKKEYSRRFIENAKAQGWAVQVDKSYRVISVRPIRGRKPTQIFDESHGSGRRYVFPEFQ